MQLGEVAVGLQPKQCAGVVGAAIRRRAVQRAVRPCHQRARKRAVVSAVEIMQLAEGAIDLHSKQRAHTVDAPI